MKYEEPIIEIMKWKMHDVICSSPVFGDNEDQEFGDDDGKFAE